MIERFKGDAGQHRLIMTIRSQRMVQEDETLAKELAKIVTLKELKTGERFITQDDHDNDMFLILSGQVLITVNGREVAFRHSGDHVGEMAVIDPAVRRSASATATETTVVAKITEPEFADLADKYPDLWRRLAMGLASRLRERNKHVQLPNPRPVVFVGSSSETLEIARAIQSGLLHDDTLVTVWTDDVFRPSHTTIEDIETQIKLADFAVIIFGPDDMVLSRDKIYEGPRDNVLVELGMFMGALGRERTLFVKPLGVTLKMPSDLFGLTPLEYMHLHGENIMPAVAPVCSQIRRTILRLGPK